MSYSINKVIILGNITKDPEFKTLPSGSGVCNFSIATNRTYKTKDGDKKQEVEYHNIVCFGKTAENVAEYMRKGNSIYVEGRLQTRSWEDKDTGSKKYKTEILAESVQFGPRKTGAQSEENQEEKADKELENIGSADEETVF